MIYEPSAYGIPYMFTDVELCRPTAAANLQPLLQIPAEYRQAADAEINRRSSREAASPLYDPARRPRIRAEVIAEVIAQLEGAAQ